MSIIAQNHSASRLVLGETVCALCYDSLSTQILEDPLRQFAIGLACVLLAGSAMGQANSEPVLKPRANTPVQDLPSAPADTKISPDAPVITIQGACEKGTPAADCKTVVTRAEFEKVVSAVQPNMPKPQQRQFAARYVAALVLANRAHEMGLDRGPQFDEQMQLQRLQLLARLAGENMQKEASSVSDAEIEAYYKQHSNEFQTISYDKLYVAKTKQGDAATQKPVDPDAQKNSETAMKEEADKLRARAAAGEDFVKLQQEAYDFAGQKLKAVDTRVNNVSKGHFPPSDAAIFDLKAGEVSQVFNDPQGYMIYKIEAKQEQPLADVRNEITQALQQKKLQEVSQDLQKTATEKTKYDDAYFAVPAAPSLRNPGEAPPPSAAPTAPPVPGKK